MPDFDVTMSCIGSVRITANTAEEAMTAANKLDHNKINWFDDHQATDAQPLEEDG